MVSLRGQKTLSEGKWQFKWLLIEIMAPLLQVTLCKGYCNYLLKTSHYFRLCKLTWKAIRKSHEGNNKPAFWKILCHFLFIVFILSIMLTDVQIPDLTGNLLSQISNYPELITLLNSPGGGGGWIAALWFVWYIEEIILLIAKRFKKVNLLSDEIFFLFYLFRYFSLVNITVHSSLVLSCDIQHEYVIDGRVMQTKGKKKITFYLQIWASCQHLL